MTCLTKCQGNSMPDCATTEERATHLRELVDELADLRRNIVETWDVVQRAYYATHDAADAVAGAAPTEANALLGFTVPSPEYKGEGILGEARNIMSGIGDYMSRINCAAVEIIADIERL